MTTSTQTPAIVTDADGRTHIVWNQNGMIYHAYYNPAGDQWVESAPIAGSTSSKEIKISPNISTGRVGDTSNSGISVFWLEGEGNKTEIKKVQGILNNLGQFKWSQKQTISNDAVHDENMDIVTTADGNILVISEKVDLDDPQADKDLYTQIVDLKNNQPIYDNLFHFNPVTTDSFIPKNSPALSEISEGVEEQELLPGTFLFTIVNEIGWEHPLSFIKEVAIKNVLSYGGGTGLAKEEESKNVLAYLMARDDLSVSLVLGEYAEVMAQGRAEGKVNLEFGLNEGGSTLSASDAFRFLFQTDLNLLPLLGIPPLEVGNTGIELQAGIILGVSFTVEQEWEVADFDFPPELEELNGKVKSKQSTATAAATENASSDYWYYLVRADGSPAQLGDDPSQLYWLINKDEAIDNFFAPPPGTTVGGPLTEGTNTGTIGLTAGIFGQAKLEAGGISLLDLGADLSITANFEVFPNQKFTGLSELLTLDIGLFGFGTEIEVEGEQNFGPEELFDGMEADFIKGSSAVYGDNPIDGNKIPDNLTDDSSPDLVTAENGDIYAVWISDTHNINDLSHVLMSKSVDGGATWNPPSEIPNSQGMNFDPVIGITSSGQILVTWTNGSSDIFDGDQDNDGKADVDPNKLDQALAETTLYYSVSNDGGATWTEGTPVLPGIQTPQKMSLSQMSDGKLLLTWFVADEDNDAIPEDKLYSAFWNGSTWSPSLLVATGDIQLLETPVAATIDDSPTIFWTETVSPDPNSAPDKVNIYYNVYSQQYGKWLNSPILFSPDVSNLARLQDNPEVLVVGNNSNTEGQLGKNYNSIVGEKDVSLVIPHLQGTGASQLHIAPVSVKENDKKAVVFVYRSGDINEKVSFNYQTLDSSATAGADYVSQSGTLTFAPGQVVKKITIPLLDDLIAEKRVEKFRVMITSDHPDAHHLIDGLRAEKGQIELIATVTVIENDPTNLSEINSGFILEADKEAQTGMAVAAAGDINGDGTNDFLVGAPAKNRKLNAQDDTLEGAVYVVYGQSNIGIADQKLSLDNLNSTNGLIIWGPENSRLGTSFATTDFDGDGKKDLILGAPENPVSSKGGTVYILPGSSTNQKAQIDLSSIPALKLQSNLSGNNAGYKVAVGDVNGDSISDLIISAPATNKVYVVYGNAIANNLNSHTTLNLDNLGTNGFVISNNTGELGTGLDLADVNNDGFDDLLLGSPQANPVDYSKSPDAESKPPLYGGQVYVVFGNKNLNSQINLNQLNGSNGFVLKGQAFYNPPNQDGSTPIDPNLQPDSTIADSAGTSVVNLGDINGDQIDDLIISAADSSVGGVQARGRAYVVFGKNNSSVWSSSLDLTKLDGTNGFIINGIYDPNHNLGGNTGYSISAVGDVNVDGFNDLLISAPTLSTNGDNSATGQSYLILGTSTPIKNGILDLSDPEALKNRVFLFNNPNQGSQLGMGLGSVGDVNGDNSPDLALATPQVYPNKETSEVYIAFGHPWMGAGGSIDVNKLRSDNGFVFSPPTNNQLGTVRLGGDINGDGYADTLIADAGFNGLGGKTAYLFFGSDPLQPTNFSPSVPITLNSSDGLIQGIQSLDSGDFNHDGIADLAIGRSGDSQNSYATIIFGRQDSSFWSNIDTSNGIEINDLLTKNGGVKVNVSNISNQGELVNVAAGDFNGDGSDDLLINSSNLNPFIVFGKNNWQGGTVSSVSVPSQSLVIKPEIEQSIVSVNSLGDVNGDGYIDFGLISVTENKNSVYVVFGKKTLVPNSSIDLAYLDGTNGFTITDPGDGEAASISSVGDLNGDGFGDLAFCFGDVVDKLKNPTYILFGSYQIGKNGTFNLSQINGSNGFVLSSSQSRVYTVTGGGDVNGDGYEDLVVGAPAGEDSSNNGNVYTIYGAKDIGATGKFDLSSLDNSTNGFVALGAQPNSFAGHSIGGIDDVNGDGYADLGIGAGGDNNTSVSGLAYNVFGYPATETPIIAGTFENDILSPPDVATPSNPHIMNGEQGNDILQSVGVDPNPDSGEKGRIVMNGGQGNDLLSIGSLIFDRLDGGSGEDTLQLNSYILSSNNLDLTDTSKSSRIHGIENIDLGCNNRVTLNLQTLTGLSDTTNTFKILGHSSLVVASDYQNWIKQQPFTDQETGITYDVYSNQGTRLLIQQSKNTFESMTKTQLSVYGTNKNDQLSLGFPEHFTGKGNVVFAQAGQDLIDLTSSSGSNQVYSGTGDDTLIPGINDLLYGGVGDDMLISSNSQGGNILEGEKGNDTFYLGQNEEAFGGEGNDRFFMQGKGKNIVFGGSGRDEYWIADMNFPPSFNAIMDFESGKDTIGLKGLASRQDEVKLTQYGHDVLISLGNQYLARVLNVFQPFLKVSFDNQDLLIQAEEPVPIKVVNNYDSGAGSLRQAIIDAGSSSHPGPDIIDLTSIGGKTIQLNSPLPPIATGNDLVFQTAGVLGSPTIKASTTAYQNIFTIKGANVSLSYLNLVGGFAKGGDGLQGGGGGLGAGGALTILDNSTVTVDNVTFSGNQAQGGNGSKGVDGSDGQWTGTPNKPKDGGGGGNFNASGQGSEGGAHGSVKDNNPGGDGEDGDSGGFGVGGGGGGGGGGGSGPTGNPSGGDGGWGGDGGFGAGGGAGAGGGGNAFKDDQDDSIYHPGYGGYGGDGDFAGADGTNGKQGDKGGVWHGGDGGDGGTGGDGGGLGGAVFAYSAHVTITNSFFNNNKTVATSGSIKGKALGGALFVSDYASVIGNSLHFSGNSAPNRQDPDGFNGVYGQFQNNDDVYGVINAYSTAESDLFKVPALTPELVVAGTPGADHLTAGVDFTGENNIIFTDGGKDIVDVLTGGYNRINLGSGNDTVYAAKGDQVFGAGGDDLLDATNAKAYRLDGGKGDDTFYLGTGGSAIGGDGDDQFFVQNGGDNLLTGGMGADAFWIVTGDLPQDANTIVDFTDTDVLGIAGQGANANFGFDDLTLSGNNILIGTQLVATLQGIQTEELTANNFVFV